MVDTKRALLTLGFGAGVACAVGAFFLAAPACAVHNCDAPPQPGYYSAGHMVDPNTWESNAIDQPWLDYSAEYVWVLILSPEIGEREIISTEGYLSTDKNPGATPLPNWTLGSGNPVEWSARVGNTIVVHNDTCGQYFLRVVIRVAPVAPGGTLDAGVTTDAAPTDAPPGDALTE